MRLGQKQSPIQVERQRMKRVNNFIFDLKDQIGSGYSSKVYRGKNCLNGQSVAIKVVQLANITNELERVLLSNECHALSTLEHPNILKSIYFMQTTNNFYFMTEIFECTLQNYLSSNGCFSENKVIQFLNFMVQALSYLQSSNILHRDVKLSNILYSKGRYVLGDFGFCEFASIPVKQKRFNVGSPMYMSPEAYNESLYSFQSDIWSLGICVIQLLHGSKPFTQMTYNEMIQQVCKQKFYKTYPISEKLKKVLSCMLQYHHEKRITGPQLRRLLAVVDSPIPIQLLNPRQNLVSSIPNYKGVESVQFLNTIKQIKFKQAKKRKVAQVEILQNQENISKISSNRQEMKSFRSHSQQSNLKQERQFFSNKIKSPQSKCYTKISVLQDLTHFLLTDEMLGFSVNKLRLLQLLTILPNNTIPSWIIKQISLLPVDQYMSFILKTIQVKKLSQISHYMTFLLNSVNQEYNDQQVSMKVSDDNYFNRIYCLQHSLYLWGRNEPGQTVRVGQITPSISPLIRGRDSETNRFKNRSSSDRKFSTAARLIGLC